MMISLSLWPTRRRPNTTGARTAPPPFLNDSQWKLIEPMIQSHGYNSGFFFGITGNLTSVTPALAAAIRSGSISPKGMVRSARIRNSKGFSSSRAASALIIALMTSCGCARPATMNLGPGATVIVNRRGVSATSSRGLAIGRSTGSDGSLRAKCAAARKNMMRLKITSINGVRFNRKPWPRVLAEGILTIGAPGSRRGILHARPVQDYECLIL